MKAKAYTVKLLITCILQCEGLSWWRQPDHKPMEVFNSPIGVSKYVALPSVISDLPRASDILPGHTLIRPDMGSLRSAVKFPKKEIEDGARVYGNMKAIGVSVGNNERILNTGFRRSYDDGYKVPWKKYKQMGRRDMSDENYLDFKSKLIPNQRHYRAIYGPHFGNIGSSEITVEYKKIHSDQMEPNRNVPSFLTESNEYAPAHKKPFYANDRHATRPKKSKSPGISMKRVLLYGTMMVDDDDDENMMASSKIFRNSRKDFDEFELKGHASTMPVHWEYMILSDDLNAKKKKVIKLLDGSSEEDKISKRNIELSKIVAEFLNDREQSPSRKVSKVHKPKPISVINPESEDKKDYYAPPQKLVDYLNSRDLFDHVKISDSAPTLNELVPISPPEEKNIRKWWFFNQDDYKPFLN